MTYQVAGLGQRYIITLRAQNFLYNWYLLLCKVYMIVPNALMKVYTECLQLSSPPSLLHHHALCTVYTECLQSSLPSLLHHHALRTAWVAVALHVPPTVVISDQAEVLILGQVKGLKDNTPPCTVRISGRVKGLKHNLHHHADHQVTKNKGVGDNHMTFSHSKNMTIYGRRHLMCLDGVGHFRVEHTWGLEQTTHTKDDPRESPMDWRTYQGHAEAHAQGNSIEAHKGHAKGHSNDNPKVTP